MCGICGIIDYRQGGEINPMVINNMCSRMVHRGPDSAGTYVDNNYSPAVGLGHRRLKIIDLSESAHQPMSNEDKTIWIVFNGEIYNFQELRRILQNKGHKFTSHSDTEVIIHLYEEEGIECVKKLRGMFALGIWDRNNKTLLLARDRFGKKPLLYSFSGGVFSFASEFNALFACVNIPKEINLRAIPDYMTFGYIPAPESIYSNVYKLLPGHILILKHKEVKIQRYWQLEYKKKNNISFQEAVETTEELLREAVKIRLYSDVPLGVFLSGGIDSSTVVGMMARLNPANKIKTFSIGFDDKDFDELKYARIVARQFNTEHHEFIVKPNALEVLPELVERYGEPYADSSCIPTYYVAKETRQYVTVALNGDGADELFSGYERYKAFYLSNLYNRLPRFFRKRFIELPINLMPTNPDGRTYINLLKRFLRGTKLPSSDRYLHWIAFFDEELQQNLYTKSFLASVPEIIPAKSLLPYFTASNRHEILDDILCLDTNTYLPNDLLVKMDIATMANSLEARSPFLDHRLAEFVASLRADFKMRHFIKKFLLKRVIKDFIPKENINRPKMGFGLPVGKWFRHELKGLLTDTLLSGKSLSRGYFNPDFIKSLIARHLEAKADYTQQLWCLLMLELWHRRYID